MPFILQFGKYAGRRITHVPVGYLRWMINQPTMDKLHHIQAKKELERRGSILPTIEVSGHAIDRASLRVLHIWQERPDKKEGLWAWLTRLARDAWESTNGKSDKTGTANIEYHGMNFVFETELNWPVLKTITLNKKQISQGGEA